MVLDRDGLIDRVARGMTTAADADALREVLFGRPRGRRRLAPSDVREMRHVWRTWRSAGTAGRGGADAKGYGALGRIFGVSAWTARDVVKGRTWRDAGGQIEVKP